MALRGASEGGSEDWFCLTILGNWRVVVVVCGGGGADAVLVTCVCPYATADATNYGASCLTADPGPVPDAHRSKKKKLRPRQLSRAPRRRRESTTGFRVHLHVENVRTTSMSLRELTCEQHPLSNHRIRRPSPEAISQRVQNRVLRRRHRDTEQGQIPGQEVVSKFQVRSARADLETTSSWTKKAWD